MSDWYDKAEDAFLSDLCINTQVNRAEVEAVYNCLYNIGLLDYDVLKEFFLESYPEDE